MTVSKKDPAEQQVKPPVNDTSVDAKAAGDDHKDGPTQAADAPQQTEQQGVLAPEDQAAGEPVFYDDLTLDEMKAKADELDVSINADVEKSELVKELRAHDTSENDPIDPSYDAMSLKDLRALADSRDVHLSDEFVRAHLVTELRAADTRWAAHP